MVIRSSLSSDGYGSPHDIISSLPDNEKPGAFIILDEGAKLTEEEVRDWCRGKIARYKIPKYVFFVKEYPLTGSGKIQKFKLRELSLKLCAEQGIEVI